MAKSPMFFERSASLRARHFTRGQAVSAAVSLTGLAFVLSGCSHHGAQNGPSGNTLRYPMVSRPTTFDPAMVQDGVTIDMLQNLFEGLVAWTPDNKVAPALAQSWDVSKDGLTYTFHLRHDVKFQDGSAMTAQDVYYSFRRSLDPALQSPVAIAYMDNIVGANEVSKGTAKDLTGIKVVDPYTVEIHIKKPGVYWIYTLTYPTCYVVSKAEALPTTVMKDADVEHGAGTGPYRLSSYNPDQEVKLVANPAYYEGAPKLSGIDRPIVVDSNTRHSMYLNGQIDIVDEQRGDLDADMKDPDLQSQMKAWPRAATYYIALNQKMYAPFRDARVRQAFAYATDKEQIRKVVLEDRMDAAEDILPEGIPGYDPAFKGLPYDPAKARQLLAEAGYPGGKGLPPIDMYYNQSYALQDQLFDFIRQQWQENLGVTLTGRRTEASVFFDQEDKDLLPAFQIRWAADYLDQQDYYTVLLRSGGSQNHVGYSNPKFDALCDAADTEQDPAKRSALYRQAARIAADDVPVIPLYYQKDFELVKPYVRDIEDGLMGHLPYKHTYLQK
jgi:ABC-type transport system substrate-binding protein